MADLVFDNPEHANGGCIFADPSVFLTDENLQAIIKAIMSDIMSDIDDSTECCEVKT